MTESNDGERDEERGFQILILTKLQKWATKMKLPKTTKNLQFCIWLKEKKDPKAVYAELKLAGLDPKAAKANPEFADYLAYSKIWNDRGGRYMTRS